MAELRSSTIRDCWYVLAGYSVSVTATQVTIDIASVYDLAESSTLSYYSGTYSLSLAVTGKATVTVSGTGNDGNKIIPQKTYTFARTAADQSVTVKVTSTNTNYKLFRTQGTYAEWGPYTDTATASVTITVPKLATYAVTYNANGFGTAPASQTKTYGTALTLRPGMGTVNGAKWRQWNTKADGTGTGYAASASYTANAALALYAIWWPRYAVTYDANGGAGAPQTAYKAYGDAFTVSTTRPTRQNCRFMEWNTKADGTGTSYQPGASYATNAALALHAIWQAVPQISSLTVVRCSLEDGAYVEDDEGEYAEIRCDWSIDATAQPGASAQVSLSIGSQSGEEAEEVAVESGGTGTSGTAVGHASGIDTNMQYTVTATVSCLAQSTSRSAILTRAFFIMDFNAGGQGVGIGSAAPESGLEVGYQTTFDHYVTSDGGFFACRTDIDLDEAPSAQRGGTMACMVDRDGTILAQVRGQHLTDGRTEVELVARRGTGDSIIQNIIAAYISQAGARSYSVSDPAAFRTAIGAAGASVNSAGVWQDGYTGASNRAFFVSSPVNNSASPWNGTNVALYVMTDRLQIYNGSKSFSADFYAFPSMLTNLGSKAAANPHGSTAPRPGVTGTLGIGNGGTGATSAAAARANLATCTETTGLFTGISVSAGGTCGTSTNVFKYKMFWIVTSGTGACEMLGVRSAGMSAAACRIWAVGGIDDGSASYVSLATFDVTAAGKVTLKAASTHRQTASGVVNTALKVTAVYGVH